jgi:hypothetical protein
MRLCLLFTLIFAFHQQTCVAQARNIRVKAGDDVAQAYSANGFYRFPQFGKTTLYYKNGSTNEGNLFNYNIFSANLQFIGDKGDTLELGGRENIDSVVCQGTRFIFNNGFLEFVNSVDSMALLKKTTVKMETENIGAYGVPNATASITNMRSFTNGAGVYNLTLNQDVVITEVVSWFFVDKNNEPLKANKTNLLKLLPVEKQTKTEPWWKQNKTSWTKSGP